VIEWVWSWRNCDILAADLSWVTKAIRIFIIVVRRGNLLLLLQLMFLLGWSQTLIHLVICVAFIVSLIARNKITTTAISSFLWVVLWRCAANACKDGYLDCYCWYLWWWQHTNGWFSVLPYVHWLKSEITILTVSQIDITIITVVVVG